MDQIKENKELFFSKVVAMKLAVSIVEAKREHVPDIRAILGFYIENTLVTWRSETPSLQDMMDKFEARGKLPWFVALDQSNAVLGFAYCSKFRESAGWAPTAEVTIYIEQNHRRKGLGRKLLAALIEKTKQEGLSTLVSLISFDYATKLGFESQDLHEALGFKQIGLLSRCGFKNGKWMDCIMMQLML
jgi:L-amino acid N-acyltransferase YncA